MLSELITEVQALTGREDDTRLITSSRIVRWLNEAQIEIVQKCIGHIDLEVKDVDAITLVAGTYSYSFSALTPTVMYPLRAYYMDGARSGEIEYLDTDEFDDEYPDPTSVTGTIPQCFTRRGSSLELFPVPSSAEAGKYLRLDYTKRPTAFTTSTLTATCDMSDADKGLIFYAVAEAFRAIGNKQAESDSWRNNFLVWLEEYRQEKDGLYLSDAKIL